MNVLQYDVEILRSACELESRLRIADIGKRSQLNPVPLRLVMIQPRMDRAEFRVLESELRDYLLSVPEHSLSE